MNKRKQNGIRSLKQLSGTVYQLRLPAQHWSAVLPNDISWWEKRNAKLTSIPFLIVQFIALFVCSIRRLLSPDALMCGRKRECGLGRMRLSVCMCLCFYFGELVLIVCCSGLCLSFVFVPQTWDSKIPAITAFLSIARNVSPSKVPCSDL
jgi:hypothetical protein